MKQIFTFLFCTLLFNAANATKHVVTCQNSPSHFLPVTINVTCGDTVHWTWVAGTHIVGPINATDIPAGAAMWSGPIDASHLSFEYVVTMAGNYHYVCHPNTPHGEDAYIVASMATGVPAFPNLQGHAAFYPNPFSDKLTIEPAQADLICIFNILGEKSFSQILKNTASRIDLDLATLPKGIFFCSLYKEGVLVETKRIIKN
jgi:plastocyanin